MRFRLIVVLAFTLIATAVILPVQTVFADASATVTVLCDRMVASGTATSPYVTLYAENNTDSSYTFVVIPVTGGHFFGVLPYPQAPSGTSFSAEVWGTNVSSYTNFGDPGYYDGGPYFSDVVGCHPGSAPGPGVPDGYVLRPITCDTPVYDTPAGSPIGSAAVHAGQTFYVNPTPEIAADGSSWTRIFVSSSPDPYIPTSCVG